ncbi:MAG: ISL3 family transposase, partial [Phormidesmis sp.]
MEFLQSLLPGAGVLRLERYELEDGDHLTLRLSSTQTIVPCPLCGGLTQRIHSHYERTLADLPCIHFRLKLILQVCKFFCPNTECCRRVFTERLPEVAAPWARKTVRFIERLQSIGLALGGAAGARLGNLLGYASSGSTLLNHLHRLPLPTFKTPKALGVDDFAFRKGHHYGTILVDLETHQPIALLADRKAETLIEWLQAHPGIEVLSRDRSKTYKSAMDKAAPTAMQVADRFHLVKNLSEVLERVLGDYRSELKKVEHSQQQATIAALPEKAVVARPNPTATEQAQQRILSNQKHRIKQQKAIKKMQAQQCRPSVIARTLGVSRHTVARYGAAPDFPTAPARRPTFGRSLLAPYKQQLLG